MTHKICTLSNTIHLIVPLDKWEDARTEHGKLIPSTPGKLKDELSRLSCSTGIPVLVETFNDARPRVVFCTERLEVACSLSNKEDAYYLAFINPLSVRRRSQLARQAVLVLTGNQAPWAIHKNPNELQAFFTVKSGYLEIKAAWEQAASQAKSSGQTARLSSPAHTKFFSDVGNLIDIAHEAERDSKNLESVVVLGLEPVAAERYAREVYRARVQSHNFKVRDHVWVGEGAPGEKGIGYAATVVEAGPASLTLSFRQQPDAGLLRSARWIKPSPSFRQYEIQMSALRALQDGSSANPHLLNIIVDGLFAETKKPLEEMKPTSGFNNSQRVAIGHADDVPDLMLVIGPPGTGKTKCISEMARSHARREKRVLITSKNNRAVDNVLEKLQGLKALRIGREDAISAEVQSLMIDAKARELQNQIIFNTTPLLASLDRVVQLWPRIEIALGSLEQASEDWRKAILEYELQKQKLGEWEDEVYKSYQPVLERLQKIIHNREKQMARISAEVEFAAGRQNGLLPYARIPLIGRFFNRSIEQYRRKIQELESRRSPILQEREQTWEHNRRVFESYKSRISESEEALERKNTLNMTASKRDEAERFVHNSMYHLNRIFTSLGHTPLNSQVASPQEIPPFIQDTRVWHRRMRSRHQLLHDWHELLGTRHQALYPSLIQAAEVVGATCIGIATDARFEDLDFDVVIADEAGQIQVMDLLVPLVRAKRAVLVGDHKQLPPMVSDEIKARLNVENPEQMEWLEKSLFELIHNRASVPSNRKIMLDTQYRIPGVIADMISSTFYADRYKTGHARAHADPFFDRPLVFIDTKGSANRRETRTGGDDGPEAGYTNNLEAELIASLVLAYQKYGCQWGVIVPYKKQAELIRRKLQQQVSTKELEDWVATVDSFQGKERDVIIYGFTRSNKSGRVGFMRELRRLNVSLTRASNQLIVIGDSGFLTSTAEAEFSSLVGALLDIAMSSKGAYFHAGQLGQLLAS